MHFKWTNVVFLSMDMLISSMVDVVIILAKLVCHLCYLCFVYKLNYFVWCAHALGWCYNNILAPMAPLLGF
jgi:hypothetical protein